MKKPIPTAGTRCVVCKNLLTTNEIVYENYEFSKPKRGKTIYFHQKCYEKELKKG
jgi:hypothetical protein